MAPANGDTAIVHLRGIGWDHIRCRGPLEASLARYRREAPTVDVSWSYRSLHEFGEGALDVLAEEGCDLVVFDHPFAGEAAAQGYLADLTPYLPAGAIEAYLADSVGQSARSYQLGTGFYGLPIDAAAQVAASRPDLLQRLGRKAPATLADVFDLAEAAAVQGQSIVVPLKPTDALCCLITLTANAGHPVGRRPAFVPREAGLAALETLLRLAAFCPPECLSWNPIRCLDAMRDDGDLVYAPYTFGYSSYCLPVSTPQLGFHDIPAAADQGCRGALLGGAGIGVLSTSRHIEAAAAYAHWLCRPENQAGWYVTNGGQPGSRAAWSSPAANAVVDNFFANTLRTLDGAYLRPRFAGFVDFFRAATLTVHAALTRDATPAETIDRLNADWQKTLSATGRTNLEGVDDAGA